MRKQTRAREVALQAVYQYDLARKSGRTGDSPEELDSFLAQSTQDPYVLEAARRLVGAVVARIDDLDARIASTVANWSLARIAPIDRSILRIALVELLDPGIPPKVAIDEAIELAKKFSTEHSGAFVNGVLDRIYKDLADQDRRKDGPGSDKNEHPTADKSCGDEPPIASV